MKSQEILNEAGEETFYVRIEEKHRLEFIIICGKRSNDIEFLCSASPVFF